MDNKNSLSIITEKDILILKKLLEDGRKSSSSISKEIDLGREIVNYRIKRLIKENLIVKFVPKINDGIFHYREYNILLKLNIDDEISKNKFIKEKIGNKYLIWVIKSNKGWDLMVRLFASSIDEFKSKLAEILEEFQESLTNYYTIITSDEIKESEKEILCQNLFENYETKEEDFSIIKKEALNLDNKDKDILNLLEEDARIQYKEISEKLEISSDTVKYRIDKMKSQGVIESFDPIINFNKIGMYQYACIIKFNFLSKEEEKKIIAIFRDSCNVIKAIKSLNFEEYFMNLVFREKEEVKEFQKSLENIFVGKIEKIEIFKLD